MTGRNLAYSQERGCYLEPLKHLDISRGGAPSEPHTKCHDQKRTKTSPSILQDVTRSRILGQRLILPGGRLFEHVTASALFETEAERAGPSPKPRVPRHRESTFGPPTLPHVRSTSTHAVAAFCFSWDGVCSRAVHGTGKVILKYEESVAGAEASSLQLQCIVLLPVVRSDAVRRSAYGRTKCSVGPSGKTMMTASGQNSLRYICGLGLWRLEDGGDVVCRALDLGSRCGLEAFLEASSPRFGTRMAARVAKSGKLAAPTGLLPPQRFVEDQEQASFDESALRQPGFASYFVDTQEVSSAPTRSAIRHG